VLRIEDEFNVLSQQSEFSTLSSHDLKKLTDAGIMRKTASECRCISTGMLKTGCRAEATWKSSTTTTADWVELSDKMSEIRPTIVSPCRRTQLATNRLCEWPLFTFNGD
jgi:hypothetical protein